MGQGQKTKRSERDKLFSLVAKQPGALFMDSNEAHNHPTVAQKLQAVVVPLHSGDWAFEARGRLVGIERKAWEDLVSSWVKKRLARQVTRMLATYDTAILLIQGMPHVLASGQLWTPHIGKLKRTEMGLWADLHILQVRGLLVWYSTSLPLVAAHVARIHKWYKDAPLTESTSTYTPLVEGVERRLLGFDGIGPERARRLLSKFGSVRALATASVEDVMQVKGFGKALAKALVAQFEEVYPHDE